MVREVLHEEDRKSYGPDEASKLCNGFSLFLIDKLNRIASVVRDKLVSTACMVHPPMCMSTLEYVTTDEVADVIQLLPQKSSPLDVVPVSLLKLSADIMAPLIDRLANLLFMDSIFPYRYKSAQVLPLLTKFNYTPQDPANYRPISNLCTFSKILEKLFLFMLQLHNMKSANYCKFQSAYRKSYRHSTEIFRGPPEWVGAQLCWRSIYISSVRCC